MALAFRLPRHSRLDYSFGAVLDAQQSLARVQAKHSEVAEVADRVQRFCDDHLFIVHVHRKPAKPQNRE